MQHLIRVLTEDITNRIAAGEVVERPASIVKELVENAIDAGATAVYVEVMRGGIQSIRITDNGCGIPADQVANAFLPHATSKISSSDDLFDIRTLGFRGEALPSIASVARVTMHTRTADADMGVAIRIEGGAVLSELPDGCPVGTTVEVADLFFNTPVRLKFLKSPAAELGAVGETVARLILSNPGVSIRFASNGSTIYHSSGSGKLADAIYCALGREAAQSMTELAAENGAWRLYGMIGQPLFARGNRGWQYTVINGRAVKCLPLSKAIEQAYGTRLMIGRFPTFVLHLELPADEIDVNVHPNKLEIRLRREQELLDWVRREIEGLLASHDRVLPPVFGLEEATKHGLASPGTSDLGSTGSSPAPAPQPPRQEIAEAEAAPATFAEHAAQEPQRESFVVELPPVVELSARRLPPRMGEEADKTPDPEPMQIELPAAQEQYRIIGQLFKTYLMIQSGDLLLFVDQHAAQERLLYDRYVAEMQRGDVATQTLLAPIPVTVSPEEAARFDEHQDLFAQMGFVVERQELQLLVYGLPLSFRGASVETLIDELISQLAGGEVSQTLAVRRERLAKAACKSAIKAGDTLAPAEISALLEQIQRHEGALTCPHGRPIIIAMTKVDLEKRFRRLV